MNSLTDFVKVGLITAIILTIPAAVSLLDRVRCYMTGDVDRWARSENMPSDLKKGVLFMNEESLSMDYPVALHGRVDQVYRTVDDWLVPVDTKTRSRHRVYDSDILQLSIYATILAHTQGIGVANYGYLRTVVEAKGRGRTVRYHLVKLLAPRKVLKVVSR